MGCKKDKHHGDENCVCEVLKAVADAQDEVAGTSDCDVSCHKSIRDLLAGVRDDDLDTIPLILYCGDCEPFEGFGAFSTNGGLTCIRSFIFRVSSVDDNCCAKLELLTTDVNGSYPKDPCCQLQGAEDFFRTGVCITVDLDCFCAVTCLDPVAALPYTASAGASK